MCGIQNQYMAMHVYIWEVWPSIFNEITIILEAKIIKGRNYKCYLKNISKNKFHNNYSFPKLTLFS